MDAGGGNILRRALDFERRCLDFYCDVQARCASQLGGKMFSMLARDKLRLVTKLAEIHSAMCQGMSLENACALTEEPAPVTGEPMSESVQAADSAAGAVRHDAEYLDAALTEQMDCLNFFEGALRRAKDPQVRSFLRQALEDEQGHRVLLLDLRGHCEQAAATLEH